MEHEALFLESLAIATSVHNLGGLVIVQAERIAEALALHPKDAKIPGILVDCVVVSTPEHHYQTWGTQYSPAMSGELRVPLTSLPALELSVRKVIARRAAMEPRANAVVNLGIGIPEGVASVAAEEHILDYIVLTAEPGRIGGLPADGKDFGSAINGDAILDQPAQFDFCDGGGLDSAFLGMAQADVKGNFNVSRTTVVSRSSFAMSGSNTSRLAPMPLHDTNGTPEPCLTSIRICWSATDSRLCTLRSTDSAKVMTRYSDIDDPERGKL